MQDLGCSGASFITRGRFAHIVSSSIAFFHVSAEAGTAIAMLNSMRPNARPRLPRFDLVIGPFMLLPYPLLPSIQLRIRTTSSGSVRAGHADQRCVLSLP